LNVCNTDCEEKGKDKWGIKGVILGEIKMHMSRGVFQTLAMIILGTLVYVWFFFSESEKTIPIVVLVSLFILLSLEYIREGFSQKKLRLARNPNTKSKHRTLLPLCLCQIIE